MPVGFTEQARLLTLCNLVVAQEYTGTLLIAELRR